MHGDQIFLLIVLLVTQCALWAGYSIQIDRSANYWGRIGSKHHRSYFLVAAGIAYLMHLIVGGYMVADHDGLEKWHRIAFGVGVVIYYGAQMAFLPMLAKANMTGQKTGVRALLIACVVPLLATTVAAGHFAVVSKTWWVLIFSVLTLLHVAINDAALFGFRF